MTKDKTDQQAKTPKIDIAKAMQHGRPNDLLSSGKFFSFLKKNLKTGNEFSNYTKWSKEFAQQLNQKQKNSRI